MYSNPKKGFGMGYQNKMRYQNKMKMWRQNLQNNYKVSRFLLDNSCGFFSTSTFKIRKCLLFVLHPFRVITIFLLMSDLHNSVNDIRDTSLNIFYKYPRKKHIYDITDNYVFQQIFDAKTKLQAHSIICIS